MLVSSQELSGNAPSTAVEAPINNPSVIPNSSQNRPSATLQSGSGVRLDFRQENVQQDQALKRSAPFRHSFGGYGSHFVAGRSGHARLEPSQPLIKNNGAPHPGLSKQSFVSIDSGFFDTVLEEEPEDFQERPEGLNKQIEGAPSNGQGTQFSMRQAGLGGSCDFRREGEIFAPQPVSMRDERGRRFFYVDETEFLQGQPSFASGESYSSVPHSSLVRQNQFRRSYCGSGKAHASAFSDFRRQSLSDLRQQPIWQQALMNEAGAQSQAEYLQRIPGADHRDEFLQRAANIDNSDEYIKLLKSKISSGVLFQRDELIFLGIQLLKIQGGENSTKKKAIEGWRKLAKGLKDPYVKSAYHAIQQVGDNLPGVANYSIKEKGGALRLGLQVSTEERWGDRNNGEIQKMQGQIMPLKLFTRLLKAAKAGPEQLDALPFEDAFEGTNVNEILDAYRLDPAGSIGFASVRVMLEFCALCSSKMKIAILSNKSLRRIEERFGIASEYGRKILSRLYHDKDFVLHMLPELKIDPAQKSVYFKVNKKGGLPLGMLKHWGGDLNLQDYIRFAAPGINHKMMKICQDNLKGIQGGLWRSGIGIAGIVAGAAGGGPLMPMLATLIGAMMEKRMQSQVNKNQGEELPGEWNIQGLGLIWHSDFKAANSSFRGGVNRGPAYPPSFPDQSYSSRADNRQLLPSFRFQTHF